MAVSIKYRSSYNLKAFLFVLGILIILGLLYFSQNLTDQLRDEARKTVTFYAESYAKIASEYEVDDYSFFFEQFVGRISFPVVISTLENVPSDWKNLNIDSRNKSEEALTEVKNIMFAMDRENEPITLSYRIELGNVDTVIEIAKLHYGDSKLITQLEWLPYIEIAIAGIFILIGFAGFQFIRRSERRLIWAGMAKETAHQLGTPLSSLMGWMEMLEGADSEKMSKLLPEMRSDIKRLNRVANRFSQIGVGGGLKLTDLNEVIEVVINYLQKRLPQKGNKVEIVKKLRKLPDIQINRDLFEWALENIIKNSADAISKENGIIEVYSDYNVRKNRVEIRVKDNGIGIPSRFQKEIFKPGYSTKSRGWGLGLSLAKRIIEKSHHGELILKDSKKNEGTTMQIFFNVNK